MGLVLSDDLPVEVRRLKFLELEDEVPYLDPGLYIHVYMIDGHPQPVGYGLQDFGEIPEKPGTPHSEALPDSMEAALWEQYKLYRAVLTHEHKRGELRDTYLLDCARYILTNCILPSDRERVITPDDFDIVYHQATCPEVDEEDIAAILANTFQGYMEGEAIVAVLDDASRVGRLLYSDQALGNAVNAGARAGPGAVRSPAG